GLLFGGKSVEHEISIRSAKNVFAAMDKDHFEVVPIGISKAGDWYLCTEVSTEIEKGKALSVRLSAASPLFETDGQSFSLDLIFPVLHGTDGEDGSVQGLFAVLDFPVVGSGVSGSAVSMDKVLSKRILKNAGVPVADYIAFSVHEKAEYTYERLVEKLGSPFMVKAGNLGSSVGISKVKTSDDYEKALADSFTYSQQVLCEAYISGRELECGVIGNEHPQTTLPGEIVLKKHYEFYTYEAKYQDEEAIEIVVPANVSEEESAKIRKSCTDAYQALGCNDYARVDLFLTENGSVIINEINTIPGFTNVSMFPMLWQHMGISYPQLISRLIESCLERTEKEKSLKTHYPNA
ncbi:MAG: D-alanine--D-alanine ligase, partial [Cyclobacteriaceae bacterium]|nr:D-alanine--D-alanine ligase [Cyclobacteriaceae bacterium]